MGWRLVKKKKIGRFAFSSSSPLSPLYPAEEWLLAWLTNSFCKYFLYEQALQTGWNKICFLSVQGNDSHIILIFTKCVFLTIICLFHVRSSTKRLPPATSLGTHYQHGVPVQGFLNCCVCLSVKIHIVYWQKAKRHSFLITK